MCVEPRICWAAAFFDSYQLGIASEKCQNMGDQSAGVDAETRGEHLPKALGHRTRELGTQIELGSGSTSSQWGREAQHERRGDRGAGLLVLASGGSSRDHPGSTLEPFSASAYVAATGYDQSG